MKLTKEVLYDVEQERINQLVKWGKQEHDLATWHVILSEEVGEVAAEIQSIIFVGKNDEQLYNELIQVAAVAVQIAESLLEKGNEDGED